MGLAGARYPGLRTPHVHHSLIDHDRGEYVLLPTYRLPTMIHSRPANAKYLNELAHTHPLLVCPQDAERIGLETGGLARVETEIGWFVIKALVTEGNRPGVVAASHHMGRRRLQEQQGMERWSSALVSMQESGETVDFRQLHGVEPSPPRTGPRSESGGATLACTRTSPSPCTPIRSPACTAGTRRFECGPPCRKTATPTSTSTSPRPRPRGVPQVAGAHASRQRRAAPTDLAVPSAQADPRGLRLPDDERTAAARTAARGERPSALELHEHVDWSPADVWGPAVGKPSRRKDGRADRVILHRPGR